MPQPPLGGSVGGPGSLQDASAQRKAQQPGVGFSFTSIVTAIQNVATALGQIQQTISGTLVSLSANNVFTGNNTFSGTSSFSGLVTLTSGERRTVRVVTAAGAVTVTNADIVVVVNKTVGAATTVNLPAGVTGQYFTIKDGKGDAASNNITITPAAGNIDGSGTLVISTNYGSARLVYNGTSWSTV